MSDTKAQGKYNIFRIRNENSEYRNDWISYKVLSQCLHFSVFWNYNDINFWQRTKPEKLNNDAHLKCTI